MMMIKWKVRKKVGIFGYLQIRTIKKLVNQLGIIWNCYNLIHSSISNGLIYKLVLNGIKAISNL
jgi:hypothetical protein